jgi:hypothetical protein
VAPANFSEGRQAGRNVLSFVAPIVDFLTNEAEKQTDRSFTQIEELMDQSVQSIVIDRCRCKAKQLQCGIQPSCHSIGKKWFRARIRNSRWHASRAQLRMRSVEELRTEITVLL